MRLGPSIVVGLLLTAASLLSLISYHAGTSAPSEVKPTYALAITTGSGLQLATQAEARAGQSLAAGPREEIAVKRVLSCSGVMRLGLVDVGYSCEIPSQVVTTGSL